MPEAPWSAPTRRVWKLYLTLARRFGLLPSLRSSFPPLFGLRASGSADIRSGGIYAGELFGLNKREGGVFLSLSGPAAEV